MSYGIAVLYRMYNVICDIYTCICYNVVAYTNMMWCGSDIRQ